MLELFTDRARKVLRLADQEAKRLNHEYVGTEHILLGLIKEGTGIGSQALKDLGIDFDKARAEVGKLIKSGPDMITMGELPLAVRARRVLEMSTEEAGRMNHRYVGTEHLLLGLVREEKGIAANVLMNLGVRIEKARLIILDILEGELEKFANGGVRAADQKKVAGGTPVTVERYQILYWERIGAELRFKVSRGGRVSQIAIPPNVISHYENVARSNVLVITEGGGFRVPMFRRAHKGELKEIAKEC